MTKAIYRLLIDLLDLFDNLLMGLLDKITARRKRIRAKWAKLI